MSYNRGFIGEIKAYAVFIDKPGSTRRAPITEEAIVSIGGEHINVVVTDHDKRTLAKLPSVDVKIFPRTRCFTIYVDKDVIVRAVKGVYVYAQD